ncbi:MAG TPA: hypothetical protein DCK76_05870 [Desulfotomaculum sp.]|nr:MAG: Uncharacterized protein XD84_1582 [Desulfotomaculum sp. 46_80]HAG10901.1 hypothetical protein [Desulfotomaculum sp.]HBY04830.1 hypothetical protein [Desulfotomaculum sp.]
MVKPLHSVIDKVYRMANLEKASAKVIANQGAPGVDKVTVKSWQANEAAHLRQLHGALYANTYRSKPVRRVYILKARFQETKHRLSATKRKRPCDRQFTIGACI